MLQIINQPYTIRVFNNHFVLLENASSNNANLQIGEAILKADLPFISEVIATEVEICLKLNGDFQAEYLEVLGDLKSPDTGASQTFIIPVNFDLPFDWKILENTCSMSKVEYISTLLDLEFDIAMFGFLPGFIYMNGLPHNMHVPRKSNPDVRIPSNSLAVGGKYLGFYSLPSPGGWNVIGRSGVSLIQTDKLPPIMVPASARFKINRINTSEYDLLLKEQANIIDYNGLA